MKDLELSNIPVDILVEISDLDANKPRLDKLTEKAQKTLIDLMFEHSCKKALTDKEMSKEMSYVMISVALERAVRDGLLRKTTKHGKLAFIDAKQQ